MSKCSSTGLWRYSLWFVHTVTKLATQKDMDEFHSHNVKQRSPIQKSALNFKGTWNWLMMVETRIVVAFGEEQVTGMRHGRGFRGARLCVVMGYVWFEKIHQALLVSFMYFSICMLDFNENYSWKIQLGQRLRERFYQYLALVSFLFHSYLTLCCLLICFRPSLSIRSATSSIRKDLRSGV